jgi:two-component system, LytTR family, sensor kinase
MRQVLRAAAWLALLSTAVGFLFTGQMYALRREGGGMPWSIAAALSMPRWYAWAILTPGILWLDRRVARHGSLARRAALHVPLGAAWTTASILLVMVTRPRVGLDLPGSAIPWVFERLPWDLIVYAMIVGVSIAGDYAAQARQREKQLVEARLESLRAQLQPHFLFNALNTISSLTETNPSVARRLMGQLGDLLRASLTHTSNPFVTLGEELTFLDDYLAIESARFEGRIEVYVRADDDVLDSKMPGFLLQPLVENAIRHGVAPRVSGGRVEISASRAGSTLKLRIRDDGAGLPSGWDLHRHAGVGLRNVASRLEHLYGRRDLLRVEPIASGGVEACVDLPVRR